MRLATIPWEASTSAALVVGDGIAAVRGLPGREDAVDVGALIGRPLSRDEVAALESRLEPSSPRWLPPLVPTGNVFCVGKNYAEHVAEGARAEGVAMEMPTVPIWFTKPGSALVGHEGEVVHDPGFTTQLDYEGELAVVIGETCRSVPVDQALSKVFGYTILNDITARDVQQRHKQWFKGKSADTYAPCGPWVVTADDVPDPQRLQVTTTVNGLVRQDDSTQNMIFGVATLIADLSQGVTLRAGDLIATGTPSGVAWGMDEPGYLTPGDEVEVAIDGIGALRNRIVTRHDR